MMKEIINVFYGEKSIFISKDSNFLWFKLNFFFTYKVLIKALHLIFNLSIDKAEYIELEKGKFRFKR